MSSPARHPLADEADRLTMTNGRTNAEQHIDAPPREPDKRHKAAPGAQGGADPRRDSGKRRTYRIVAAPRAWIATRQALDTLICAVYVGFAFWLIHGLWPDPATRAIADNVNDQALIEWFLAHGVLVWTGDFSLVTDRLNAPEGVNLMSNASHILHGTLMAPVTAVFGAAVSFALLVALNLAATAAGWYLLFARGLRLHRGAAVIGGAVAGFAPGMISQSNSHLHMTAQWLVPPIVWCVIRLTRVTTPRAIVGTALGLGALLCAQLMLGEEVLYLTAVTLAMFGIVYMAIRWRWTWEVAPRFLTGSVIAIGMSALVLAYPLSVQLDGPQHTPNAPFAPQFFYTDLATFAEFSPLSIGGSPEVGRLATSSAEYNSYFGLPLVLLILALVVWRWRSSAVVAAAVAGLVMAYLSLGPTITANGEKTGWPSLYKNIAEVPIINGALPTRYALALIPLLAVIVTFGLDAALRTTGIVRVAAPVAVVAALAPTLPLPLATTHREPVPAFITSGAWRQCAPEGGVIVPVPLPTPGQPDLMRWPAMADAAFGIPEGFFIAPYGPGGRSSIGTYKQPTSALLEEVSRTGTIPEITDTTRAQARRDLTFWGADCVALAHVPNEAALRTTVEALLGPGQPIADVWTWKINH